MTRAQPYGVCMVERDKYPRVLLSKKANGDDSFLLRLVSAEDR